MAASDTILGRLQNRRAFNRLAGKKSNNPTTWRRSFLVSFFRCYRTGKLFFTDPIQEPMPCQARPSVLYRVRVYPKKGIAL